MIMDLTLASIDFSDNQMAMADVNTRSLEESVRTYVIHLLGTYVTILYNWLIL